MTRLELEHAIRAATTLPARIMDLKDRGQIREGFAADLVVFDLVELTVHERQGIDNGAGISTTHYRANFLDLAM